MIINSMVNGNAGGSKITMVTGEIGARLYSVYYMDGNYQTVVGEPGQMITVPLGSMIAVTYSNLYNIDPTGVTTLIDNASPGSACAVLRVDADNFIIETWI